MSPGNKPATTVTDEETIVPTSRIAHTAVDAPAVDAQLSTRRLNIMRFGYAFMGVGLVIVKWPLLLHAPSLPVMEGVVTLPADRHVAASVPRAQVSRRDAADPAVRGRLEADLDRHGRHPPPDGR
jgi:hypothetical protein